MKADDSLWADNKNCMQYPSRVRIDKGFLQGSPVRGHCAMVGLTAPCLRGLHANPGSTMSSCA